MMVLLKSSVSPEKTILLMVSFVVVTIKNE
jgi:hypothetical protein